MTRKSISLSSKQHYLMIVLAFLAVACQDRSVMRQMPPSREIAQVTTPSALEQIESVSPDDEPTASLLNLTPVPSDTPVPDFVPIISGTLQQPSVIIETSSQDTITESTSTDTSTVSPAVTITPFSDASNMYIVREGETLESIGASWGILTDELAAANGITNYLSIVPGQLLILPLPTPIPTATKIPTPRPTATPDIPVSPFDPDNYYSHTVLSGQTLYRLSVIYEFTVDELLLYNQLSDSNFIYPGDTIKIPYR